MHRDREARDVANLGLVRPPFVYLASLVAGTLLAVVWPLPILPGWLTAPLGSFLVVLAVLLFGYAVRTFRAAGTPVPGNEPTTVIVRRGPYRFTRNPIYMAFSALHLGIAVLVDSLWLVATLIFAISLMAYVVIPREEEYLQRRFGAAYLEYKASVRRWL